ncbi:MAG: hypothetical protein ACQES2_06650 [Pseudomonadota bacterium]
MIICVSSVRKKREDVCDNLTVGYSTTAWTIGRFSVATNNSGYMFIGLVGDWLVWRGFHRRPLIIMPLA